MTEYITRGEQQREEIATIKERSISLNLSDADVKRIFAKAGGAGLTVAELLQNFIGDLVDGTYSNGSDERDFADRWFERCWFAFIPEYTYPRYLIEFDALDDTVERWNDIQTARKELTYAIEHPDEYEPDDVEWLRKDIAYWSGGINESFANFKNGDQNSQSGTLEEEMAKAIAWQESLKKMLA